MCPSPMYHVGPADPPKGTVEKAKCLFTFFHHKATLNRNITIFPH